MFKKLILLSFLFILFINKAWAFTIDSPIPPAGDITLMNPEGLPYTHFKNYTSDTSLDDIILDAKAIVDADRNAIVLVTIQDDDDSVEDKINVGKQTIPGRTTFALAGKHLKIRYQYLGVTGFGNFSCLVEGTNPKQTYDQGSGRPSFNKIALRMEDRAHINGWDIDGNWNGLKRSSRNAEAITLGLSFKDYRAIYFVSNTSIKNTDNYGMWVQDSTVMADELEISNGRRAVWSFKERKTGIVNISNSKIFDNTESGLFATYGGKIYADGMVIYNNGSWGAGAFRSPSYLEISNSYIRSGPPGYGVYSLIGNSGGRVEAENVDVVNEETKNVTFK